MSTTRVFAARRSTSSRTLIERRAAFDVLFAGPAGELAEAETLRWLAERALAREALRRTCHLFDRGKATEKSVAILTALARDLAPSDEILPEWRQLRRRAKLGPQRVRRRPWCTGWPRFAADSSTRSHTGDGCGPEPGSGRVARAACRIDKERTTYAAGRHQRYCPTGPRDLCSYWRSLGGD